MAFRSGTSVTWYIAYSTTSEGTGGSLCLRCGYPSVNCYCIHERAMIRNWRDEDADVDPVAELPPDQRLFEFCPCSMFVDPFVGPILRLWPQARAPPFAPVSYSPLTTLAPWAPYMCHYRTIDLPGDPVTP